MASTVSSNKNSDEYREYIDAQNVRDDKIKQLAKLIQKHSGKVIFFTGAGISTGAGIPDFRSGVNSATGLPAGKWAQEATQSQWSEEEMKEEMKRRKKTTSTLQAIPTASHMSLVALEQAGIVMGLISQNCDGLHRRSGFHPNKLAELHGNSNLEYCAWCGKEYLRDFSASRGRHTQGRELKQKHWAKHKKLDLINPRKGNHYTGRRCVAEGCDGYLFDSTIDFGDNLPMVHINRGYKLAEEAELCIVLGSRCSVSPACDMPISVGANGRKLVVVNLQGTGADSYACLRIGAKIDDVMVPLMKELGIDIPTFKLKRQILVSRNRNQQEDTDIIHVRGLEVDGTPVDVLWNVQVNLSGSQSELLDNVPFLAKAKLTQDVAPGSKYAKNIPLPGDAAAIRTWPWSNQTDPGKVEVVMLNGNAKKRLYTMPADFCEVQDGPVAFESKDVSVINAGQNHGSSLTHVLRLPTNVPTDSRVLTLMFRAHYGELPVQIPIPDTEEEIGYNLAYEPMERVW
eukprot:CAMPEP_0184009448 /NCGR_PEP_ID=MMETSP0954-20121128/2603_1 /TAXON_ID=627963 /ORGANISM="Aplanochytrium sp, Strain PBS07" /LENGTH=512 /DNA_ID=CAMNT_0026288807 /DNA_START=69 /DNA_END=1604 /DNA_ORIENTATION=-